MNGLIASTSSFSTTMIKTKDEKKKQNLTKIRLQSMERNVHQVHAGIRTLLYLLGPCHLLTSWNWLQSFPIMMLSALRIPPNKIRFCGLNQGTI